MNLNGSPKPQPAQTAAVKHNLALTPKGSTKQGVALWNGK